ncbi:MAG: DMT family protein [Planctomycetes bacterium]|nr:DMT family protein [Planctomycetota bacterium]
MERLTPILMLMGSNLFMTYAWYGHLKDLKGKPLLVAIVLSWGVAFLEYCLQVPGNRIGFQYFTLSQLKVIQEIITMCVFALFAFVYMNERITLDYLWAGLCLVGAAYFMFRNVRSGA